MDISNTNNELLNVLYGTRDSLLKSQEEIAKKLMLVEQTIVNFGGNLSGKVIAKKEAIAIKPYSPIPIPPQYLANELTWEQKLAFAINKLGRGTVKQISDKLLEIDKNLTEDKVRKMVTHQTSKLTSENKLKVDKSGSLYVYYL
jgi:hypothetical protein